MLVFILFYSILRSNNFMSVMISDMSLFFMKVVRSETTFFLYQKELTEIKWRQCNILWNVIVTSVLQTNKLGWQLVYYNRKHRIFKAIWDNYAWHVWRKNNHKILKHSFLSQWGMQTMRIIHWYPHSRQQKSSDSNMKNPHPGGYGYIFGFGFRKGFGYKYGYGYGYVFKIRIQMWYPHMDEYFFRCEYPHMDADADTDAEMRIRMWIVISV